MKLCSSNFLRLLFSLSVGNKSMRAIQVIVCIQPVCSVFFLNNIPWYGSATVCLPSDQLKDIFFQILIAMNKAAVGIYVWVFV